AWAIETELPLYLVRTNRMSSIRMRTLTTAKRCLEMTVQRLLVQFALLAAALALAACSGGSGGGTEGNPPPASGGSGGGGFVYSGPAPADNEVQQFKINFYDNLVGD